MVNLKGEMTLLVKRLKMLYLGDTDSASCVPPASYSQMCIGSLNQGRPGFHAAVLNYAAAPCSPPSSGGGTHGAEKCYRDPAVLHSM